MSKFIANPSEAEIRIEEGLNDGDRAQIHQLCNRNGLECKSQSGIDGKYLLVSKSLEKVSRIFGGFLSRFRASSNFLQALWIG